jgi:hypothetical protein
VIHLEDRKELYQRVLQTISADMGLLDELREDVRNLSAHMRRIQPRSTTAMSLVGTDGGNNQLHFDPFSVQLIRVVDSSDNEYWLDAVTPSSDISAIDRAQFDAKGTPKTALGELMRLLGVRSLQELSHMIRVDGEGRPTSPSWVQVYRDLVEWAVLLSIVRNKDFATDTLLVHDGLLRSKVFAGELFPAYLRLLHEAIDGHWQSSRRRIYIVGLAKHSKVLTRYRLAMALERTFAMDYPAFVEIPRELEMKAYEWDEFARGADTQEEGREVAKFVGGKMFFVKFGNRPNDPVWPVDLLLTQTGAAATILSHLLSDALDGFPVPFYPRCLQKAHENAALVDFDYEVLQDGVFEAVRQLIEHPEALDAFRLTDPDPAGARYR